MSKRVEVKLVNGQVPRPIEASNSPQPEVALRGGASLAKDIVDDQLRKIEQQVRSSSYLDPEHVRSIKDMVSVLETLKKLERAERLESGLLTKFQSMSRAELLEIAGAKIIGDDE